MKLTFVSERRGNEVKHCRHQMTASTCILFGTKIKRWTPKKLYALQREFREDIDYITFRSLTL